MTKCVLVWLYGFLSFLILKQSTLLTSLWSLSQFFLLQLLLWCYFLVFRYRPLYDGKMTNMWLTRVRVKGIILTSEFPKVLLLEMIRNGFIFWEICSLRRIEEDWCNSSHLYAIYCVKAKGWLLECGLSQTISWLHFCFGFSLLEVNIPSQSVSHITTIKT